MLMPVALAIISQDGLGTAGSRERPAQWAILRLLLVSVLGIGGCSAGPGSSDPGAGLGGWSRERIPAGPFELQAYTRQGVTAVKQLHIYLHGDGRAFLRPGTVSRDPTPRESLTARLAAADPAPTVFLSRPCYFGTLDGPGCDSIYWTVERFGPTVVNAVAAAVERVAARHPDAQVTLIGYSGGGVLSLLAARQAVSVSSVITIAAPLDTGRWSELHGYTPLAPGSNPAELTRWRADLRQVHLWGDRDRVVPPDVTRSFLQRSGLQGASVETQAFPDFDHHCCWAESWASILSRIGA
jgi:pimeloyl-ACP methyl ester carboxylesterase